MKIGSYVVATKYHDGDPGDHFCVGYYAGSLDHYTETRHLVSDDKGINFRANGFRRVQTISTRRGNWLVRHLPLIEASKNRFSVWHWVHAPWKELKLYDQHPRYIR